MRPEQPAPPTEERDRFLLGCALIQSGFVDQDEDAPGWFDILQWHPCFEEANCRARDNSGPCACSGVPFIADEVWAKVGPVVEQIRAEAYERGLREATEGWEREWAVAFTDKTWPPNDSEQSARTFAALYADGRVVSRLVGPWEPAPAVNAEQPEPEETRNA
jgi:hypothetical protein